MVRRLGVITLLVAIAVILPACGGGDTGAAGFGTYVFETNGATHEYVIPAPAGDALVAEAEARRAETGGGAVTYVLASIDNTGGAQEQGLLNTFIISDEGDTYEADLASTEIGRMAQPGAKLTALFATEVPVPSVRKVFVQPQSAINKMGGKGSVQLTKAE